MQVNEGRGYKFRHLPSCDKMELINYTKYRTETSIKTIDKIDK